MFACETAGAKYHYTITDTDIKTDALNENLYLSSRNLPNVLVLEAQEADPVSLVRFAKVLITKSAVAKFEEMWG